MKQRTAAVMVALVMVGASCSEDGTDLDAAASTTTTALSSSTTVAGSSSSAPSTTSTATAPPSTTERPAPPTTAAPPGQGPLQPRNGVYTIRWGQLVVDPGYQYIDSDPDNPFWLIHTDGEKDGFAFSLELYTTGYGALWEGETGEVAIVCTEPPPGALSTGICPHLDPDGPGPQPDIIGFTASGSVTIKRLDDAGFDITIDELTLPFGLSVKPFRLRGTATA
ncbi:MAG: hypothetical protein ACR2QE_09120 [Acidimicrobiales bacterium]